MKTRRYLPDKFTVSIAMVLFGLFALLPTNLEAQEEGYMFGVSAQGGINLFLSDAYPDDIMGSSFALTFDYQPYHWIGFMMKVENGTLNGTKRYKSGNTPYSSHTKYTSVSPIFYVHATNILFGVNTDRWMDIKVVGGAGYMRANYAVDYLQPPAETREGASNVLALSAGGVMEFHVAERISLLMDVTGVADFSNSLDGIWDEDQGAAAYKGYDIIATFHIGVKYRIGGEVKTSGGQKRKYIYEPKELPTQYKGFRGFDGMERSRSPKY